MGLVDIDNDPIISFVTDIPGFDELNDCKPRPAAQFVPSWWKNTPRVEATQTINQTIPANVKTCPSFPDYFSNGFIIPMWCDTVLRYDKEKDEYNWRTSDKRFTWTHNPQDIYRVPASPTYLGNPIEYVFTAHSPWRIITAEGYSIKQLPLFFHFDNNFSIIPGIVDTDYYHNVAYQVFLHETGVDVFIPRGTPFAHIVPFKRESSTSYDIRQENEQDKLKFMGHDLKFNTKFPNSKQYLKIRKENQKSDN